jgi:hypothetical protein
VFLRERAPDLAQLLGSENPIFCESEFVHDSLTKTFADKVLGFPLIPGAMFRLYIILEGKSVGSPLDIEQVAQYSFSIRNRWYRRTLWKKKDEPPAVEPVAVGVPVIVYSGPSKYNYPLKLDNPVPAYRIF